MVDVVEIMGNAEKLMPRHNAKNIGEVKHRLLQNVINKFSPWMPQAGKWVVYLRVAKKK